MHTCGAFALAFALLHSASADQWYAGWSAGKGLEVSRTEVGRSVAKAVFQNNINTTGWATFEVVTDGKYSDENQAYAAGYIEGVLTAELIYLHWRNTMDGFCDGRNELCTNIQKYLDDNYNWVTSMWSNYTTSYWHQVRLFYEQVKGLSDGYNAGIKNPDFQLTFNQILWLNVNGDLEDLTSALAPKNGPKKLPSRVLGLGHCSALIKLLPGAADLFFAHDTWNSFQSMLRMQKKYVFNFKQSIHSNDVMPGHSMTFTSYPGTVTSGDDYYLISSGLATTETTIGNSNESLWDNVQAIGQVLETVRSMVANRLAVSARTWCVLFSRYNSGTYNNQWMVVDYSKFTKGTFPRSDVLYVLEQLPGLVVYNDMTQQLVTELYWPSYNTPAFPAVFQLGGSTELEEKYGDWFSYEKTPRALIFKRDQAKVTDLDSLMKLMRYNNFKQDPLSRCNCTPPFSAENAIAARCDLNPANGVYPFPALGHRSHGATDAKLTSSDLFKKLQFVAVSGPPFNLTADVPPFSWNTADFGNTTLHLGHPDTWRFEPITYQWQL